MGRPCSICTNDRKREIDAALLIGTPFRDIAQRFGTSVAAAHRHSRHVQRALSAVAQHDPVAYGRTVLAQVRNLSDRAVRILDRAENEGDYRCATAAIREARSCLELVARLEGRIVEHHAHIHQNEEVEDLKRRQKDIAAMPEDLRESLREAAHWLIQYRARKAVSEHTEIIDVEAESVS